MNCMGKSLPVHRSYAVKTLKLRVILRVLAMTSFCISSMILSALTPMSSLILCNFSLDAPEHINDDIVRCNLIVWVLLTHLPSERCVLREFFFFLPFPVCHPRAAHL